MQQAGIADKYLFRRLVRGKAGEATVTPSPMSDRAVARLVQARAVAAGYAAAAIAGHSLRAGFLTAAARSGGKHTVQSQVPKHEGARRLRPRCRTVPRPRRRRIFVGADPSGVEAALPTTPVGITESILPLA